MKLTLTRSQREALGVDVGSLVSVKLGDDRYPVSDVVVVRADLRALVESYDRGDVVSFRVNGKGYRVPLERVVP